MCNLERLFRNNRDWSESRLEADPDYFRRLAKQQKPRYLWIGCSDSRVPANEIVGLQPGEVFVHRNVANQVIHSDINCLSVLQFAVEVLQVEQIMVVGHYGCGGVQAAAEQRAHGVAGSWLRHIEDIADKHADVLGQIGNRESRHELLCELNVIEQVSNVCRTAVVRSAWEQGQSVEVHGLIYGLKDGLLRRVTEGVSRAGECKPRYQAAVGRAIASESLCEACTS